MTEKAYASSVLNPSYGSLLTDEQQKIRAALQPLHGLMSDDKVKQSPSWPKIAEMLRVFGAQDFAHNATHEVYDVGRSMSPVPES